MWCELHPTPGEKKELELGCNLCIPHVRATYDPLPAIELECVGSRRLQDMVHILVACLGDHGRYLPDIRGGTIPHVSGWGEVWAIRLQEEATLGHTPQGLQLTGRQVPGPRRVSKICLGELPPPLGHLPDAQGTTVDVDPLVERCCRRHCLSDLLRRDVGIRFLLLAAYVQNQHLPRRPYP